MVPRKAWGGNDLRGLADSRTTKDSCQATLPFIIAEKNDRKQ